MPVDVINAVNDATSKLADSPDAVEVTSGDVKFVVQPFTCDGTFKYGTSSSKVKKATSGDAKLGLQGLSSLLQTTLKGKTLGYADGVISEVNGSEGVGVAAVLVTRRGNEVPPVEMEGPGCATGSAT